ncbi:hypothetical protein ACWCPQ_14355 [Nocardia sp. NPDC001965]
MKEVTIVLQDGEPHSFSGVDVVLDKSEDALFVFESDGCSVTFYWPFVAYFAQFPMEDKND